MNGLDPTPAPSLVPTHSPDSSSGCWRVSSGVGKAVLLGLLLVGVLLGVTSGCTIQEITLYKTVIAPSPRGTP